MTYDDMTCETCGAPVTQNVHGEVWNTCAATIRDLQAQNAKLREALTKCKSILENRAPDKVHIAIAALEDTP